MTLAPPSIPSDAPRLADGRYVLLTRLGEGGMAVVYGAWDEDLRIWRAVKVLLPEFARRSSVRRRFEREARTMMSIRHENLVRVIEVDASRALPYLVMDLVPGGSLEDWGLRHGPMPPRLATEVAVQVCQGLCAVHRAGVVHRDVKPQNVLVDPSGLCKLTDFGVARVAGGDTRTGVAVGTVGYMAPEQLADAKSVDARSDLFSLGATLYVMLTRAPVRDLFRVVEDPSGLSQLPAPLQPIVGRCLQYERVDRPDSAAVVLEALQEAMGQLPPVPEDTPALARIQASPAPGVPADSFTELAGLLDTVLPAEKTLPVDALLPRAPEPAPPAPSPASLAETVVNATPASLPRRAELRPLQSREGRTLAHPLLIALLLGLAMGAAAVGVLAVVLSLALGYGGAQVDAAEARYQRSLQVVEDRVADREQLEQDLAQILLARGAPAPSEPLPEPGTLALAMALTEKARFTLEQPGSQRGELEAARKRLQLVLWAVDDLLAARQAWAEASQRPLGRMAVQVGISEAPSPPGAEPGSSEPPAQRP